MILTPADGKNWITGLVNTITAQPVIALVVVMVIFFILWLLFKDLLNMDDVGWEMMTSFIIIIAFFFIWVMMDKGIIQIDFIAIMKNGIKSLAAKI